MNKVYLIFLLLLFTFGCSFAGKTTPDSKVNAAISDFDSITFNAPGVLEIVQGEIESLEITGDPVFTSAVQAQVKERRLVISTISEIPSNASITYKLFVRNINNITLNSFSVIKISALKTGQFELEINGLGRVQSGEIEAANLVVRINGGGNFSADSIISSSTIISSTGVGSISITGGNTDDLGLEIESGSFLGEDFKCLSATVTVNGAGAVFVWAVEKLNATINGAGRINYFGEPTMSMSVNGGGQIVGGGRK